MRTKNILTCFLFLSFACVANAQVKVEFSPSISEDELMNKHLDATTQQQLEAALTARIAEYSKRGKLLNPQTNMIDRESANSFKDLFSLDAKVFNDIREVPEAYLRSLDEYIDLARSYFLAYGLSFGVNSAKIVGVEYDELSGRYTFDVLVSKTVEQYFKDNGTVQNGVRTYSLNFIYSLKLSDIDNALIQLIRPSMDDKKPADLYVRIFNLSLGVGYGIPSFSKTAFFKMDDKQGELSLKTGLDFSIGLSTYSNFFAPKESPNKNLFLVGGVTGFYQKITGGLKNYSTSEGLSVEGRIPQAPSTNVAGDVYRMATDVNVEEEQTLIGLRVPIGLGFRVFNNNTSSAMLTLQYVPSTVLKSRGALKNGKGDYAMEIGKYVYNTSDPKAYEDENFANAYEIGIDRSLEAAPKITTAVTHGIMVSGLYLKDLVDDERTFGIALGIHYYMPFTNLWEFSKDADKPFLYYSRDRPSYTDPGILSPFMEKVRLSHFGISLNIYNKKTRQP